MGRILVAIWWCFGYEEEEEEEVRNLGKENQNVRYVRVWRRCGQQVRRRS
jgi:hypothetical protein